MTDELDAPLGQDPPRRRRLALPKFVPYAVAGVLVAAVAGFAVWTVVADDPLGGEPFAIASVHQPAKDAKPGAAVKQNGNSAAVPPASAASSAQEGASKTVTVIDGMSGRREQFTLNAAGIAGASVVSAGPGQAVVSPGGRVPQAADAAKPAAAPAKPASPSAKPASEDHAGDAGPDPRVAEATPDGMIPKIGAGGERPSAIYASPLAPAAAANGGAQVAIVVGRLGVSAKGTEDALTKLPAAVTVAFAPYGNRLEALVARARADGREVLLQVPMEPFDYPDNDPGPQTLLTSLPPDRNIDRLHWFMSRFGSYVGIGNYMGARFAANEPAVSTVMREVAKRGLIYFDDGSAARSLVSQVAAVNNVPFARADLIVDTARTPAGIDAALEKLEALARERGSAVGAAIALPASIDHIAKWAAGAAARGITLVPISVIANKPKSS